jgi:hypothetical protein
MATFLIWLALLGFWRCITGERDKNKNVQQHLELEQ